MREDADKKQSEVAQYLHCAQQTYSRYEIGKGNPPLEIMAKLALYFNTSVDYHIGLTDVPAASKNKARAARRGPLFFPFLPNRG